FGGCVSSTEKLSSPKRLEIVFNDSLRFDNPGRYTVTVKTRRITRSSTDPSQPSAPLSLSTNAISFEVQSMSEEDEVKEVKRLSDILDATRNSRDDEIARRLSYLTGDPSAREKVRRFLNPEQRPSNYGIHIHYGLFIARNRGLVLKLIEAAMRDPNTPVTSEMLLAAIRLKTLLTYGVSPKPVEPVPVMLAPEEDPRSREIRETYLTELAAGLGKRSGASQTTTALTFFMRTPQASLAESAGMREVRRILVQQFDTLHPYSQEWLLRAHWEQMRDAALVPSLKKMLAMTGPASKNLHDTALRRLLEMAPDDARSYVVAEIRDPNSLVNPQILGALKEESLPEVDASLLEQIRQLAQSGQGRAQVLLRAKTAVLVRFATGDIYGELMQLYQQPGTNLRDGRAGLLAYFAKHNDREAAPLIEQAVAELKPGEYPQILSDMTTLYYSESMSAVLKKIVQTDNPSVAGHAAYLIGKHGSPGDEKLLEARLKRWQEQWRDRIVEADAQHQGQIERELIYGLINGKSWKPTPERVRELQTSCVTQLCKQSNIVRQ
ncbi:MAG TPA: hypothetical protein VFM63_14255, partial [Pyrinomonadaceae bacterium]|nr:hypothetical protein [Pyrinomonadaceae bacterium]